jgi:ABC-type multidrug transport system ATPase subunit
MKGQGILISIDKDDAALAACMERREAFAGIDWMPVKSDYKDIDDIIRSLKGKVTVILTTHYMEEAESLSDRVAIMKDGKLLICETAEKIKEIAQTDNFEQAFIRIVKGAAK